MSGQQVGYTRVSSLDQNPDRQLEGVTLDRTFTDSASGRSTARPQLKAMLACVRDGGTVVVHSVDRLAHNLDDLRALVRTPRSPPRWCSWWWCFWWWWSWWWWSSLASLSRPPQRVRVGRCPPALRAVGSPLRRKAARSGSPDKGGRLRSFPAQPDRGRILGGPCRVRSGPAPSGGQPESGGAGRRPSASVPQGPGCAVGWQSAGWPHWGGFGVQDRPRAGRCVGGATGSAGGGPRSGVPAGAGPCARGAGTVRRTDGPSVPAAAAAGGGPGRDAGG